MLGPVKYIDELPKAHEPFVTPRSVLLIALSTIGLSLFGHILHVQHERDMDGQRRHEQSVQSTKRVETPFQSLGEESASPVLLTPELYQQCNPALSGEHFTGYDPEKVFSGGHCSQEDVTTIKRAMDARQFDYQAVSPVPFLFPSYLQLTTAAMNSAGLEIALEAHDHNMTEDSRVLAKFFTWGLPVSSRQLRRFLGDAAVQALWHCRLVRPCATRPSLWVGTVMFMPMPYTSVIVATDWGVLNVDGWQEEPVGIIDFADVGLATNAPPTKGARVLDVTHSSGVQAILAVARGAVSATFVARSPRALRFAKFNAMLNGVTDQVHFEKGLPMTDAMPGDPKPDFDLLLASPTYTPRYFESGEENLLEVFGLASTLLTADGSFAVATHLANPRQFPNHVCQDMGLTGFSGAIGFRNPPQQVLEYSIDLAKEDTANTANKSELIDVALQKYKLLESLGVKEVAPAILFGWRTAELFESCGKWSYAGLPDPWGLDGQMYLEERPCFYSRHKSESCPHLFH